jgi:hypothetical protein
LLSFLFFFHAIWAWTQGLMHARQALYLLRHTSSRSPAAAGIPVWVCWSLRRFVFLLLLAVSLSLSHTQDCNSTQHRYPVPVPFYVPLVLLLLKGSQQLLKELPSCLAFKFYPLPFMLLNFIPNSHLCFVPTGCLSPCILCTLLPSACTGSDFPSPPI